jgi:hypothetical protein
MIKLAIDSFCLNIQKTRKILYDIIKSNTKNKSNYFNIGFIDNKFEEYVFEILKQNNTINDNSFIKKIKYRSLNKRQIFQ